jgi:hypothetical protein
VTRTWSPPTSGGLPSTARLKPRASEAKGAEVIRKGDRNVTIATSDHAAAVDAAACRTRILLGSLSLSWPPRKNSGSFVTAERTVSGRGTTVHQAITPAIRLEGGLADGDADHAVRPAAPALCSSQPFFFFSLPSGRQRTAGPLTSRMLGRRRSGHRREREGRAKLRCRQRKCWHGPQRRGGSPAG